MELCAGIPEGGTTPSYGMIRNARENISIALNVIIRPRGGDFLYSESEIQEMIYDIKIAKEVILIECSYISALLSLISYIFSTTSFSDKILLMILSAA